MASVSRHLRLPDRLDGAGGGAGAVALSAADGRAAVAGQPRLLRAGRLYRRDHVHQDLPHRPAASIPSRCCCSRWSIAGAGLGACWRSLVGVPALRCAASTWRWRPSPSSRSCACSSLNLDITGGAVGIFGIPQPFPSQIQYMWMASAAAAGCACSSSTGWSASARAAPCRASARTSWPPTRWASTRRSTRCWPSRWARCWRASSARSARTSSTPGTRARAPSTPASAYLAFVLIGGSRTFVGPVVGGLVLTALPEVLRGVADIGGLPAWLAQFLRDGRLIIFGVLIALGTVFFPHGLITPGCCSAWAAAGPTGHERSRGAGGQRGDARRRRARRGRAHVPLRRPDRGERGVVRREAGRDLRPDRAQRRGQDHAVQSDDRPDPADGRAAALPGPGHHRPAAPPDRRARHRPHLPEHAPVRRAVGAAKRDDRPARPHAQRPGGRRARAALRARRGARHAAAGHGPAGAGGPGRPARRAGPATSPTATSAGWRSPARWRWSRSCCCSTSRPPA